MLCSRISHLKGSTAVSRRTVDLAESWPHAKQGCGIFMLTAGAPRQSGLMAGCWRRLWPCLPRLTIGCKKGASDAGAGPATIMSENWRRRNEKWNGGDYKACHWTEDVFLRPREWNKPTAILRTRLKAGRSSARRERSARISTLIGQNCRSTSGPQG